MHRRLTVSRIHPESRSRGPRPPLSPVPFLRLKGRWLAAAGFPVGQAVRVVVEPGRIALEAVLPESDPD